MARLAVSGASGKTGWRVVQEAIARGHEVTAILRPNSKQPEGLAGARIVRLELQNRRDLAAALKGCDALVIATGARPSLDLFGPLKVDALAIRSTIEACRDSSLNRVVLVSSLCSGRLLHVLNLFGLILIWKRVGERWLADSGLDWTVVRPGGLREAEDHLEDQHVVFSGADQQQDGGIARRLVARVCLDVIDTPASIGKIIEITSSSDQPAQTLGDWLAA